MLDLLYSYWETLVDLSGKYAWLSFVFLCIGCVTKRSEALTYGKNSWREVRLNLVYQLLDALAVVPLLVLLVGTIGQFITSNGLVLVGPGAFEGLPFVVIVLLCVAVSDFVGYWRHRLMHVSVLWPVHAIHHSDTQMTFTTLARFHPINRLITATLNAIVLGLIGFPVVAIVLNALLRHYYGFFIHAAIPWTYGPAGRILVSPVMHRWHHIRHISGSGANFATIFAAYDWMFGTYYVPSAKTPELGVSETDFPKSWGGQMLYPFRVWLGLAPPGSDAGLEPQR